ncbi:MAG TPA: ferredoxin--NADP reductase [Anaeromyxobacteraceae bacterium]|nr:ferredoxin--NADP reductase [Anaeromyxobacteraceae bacterium]
MKKVELNAIVSQRIDVAAGLMVLRVAPDGWTVPPYEPGQFAVVGLPGSAPRVPLSDPEEPPADPDKLIRRAYSLASPSGPGEHLELFVTLVRSGELTPRLFALQPGSRLWVGPKITGMFTLDQAPPDKHLVLVATGTGIAPYMSMLRQRLLADGPRRVAVLVGARHSWDIGYVAELATMQRLRPQFSFLPTVSRPQGEPVPWGGATGHVQQLWQGGALERAWGFKPTPADTHVFLCGSPAMIEDMTALLRVEGYTLQEKGQPGQIHAEKWW